MDDPTIFNSIASALPLIIAAIVPALVAAFNKFFGERIDKRYYPILLPILGGVLAGLAKAAGFDIGDFNPETADLTTWQTIITGTLAGSASVGLHQIKKQVGKTS